MAQTQRASERPFDCLKLTPLTAALLAVFTSVLPANSVAIESSVATEASTTNKELPDLGTPARTGSASVMPGPGGITAQGRFDGIKFAVTPEYSDQTGFSVGVALASMLGADAAIGILLNNGSYKNEILLNGGIKLGEGQRLILSVGQLKQSLDFLFPSGNERVSMAQKSAGLGYQLQLGQEFLRFLEVNGYVSSTASRDLADKTFAVETSTLYELWNDPRRIAGGRIGGLQGRLGFTPQEGSLVKVNLGYERLSYDLLAGKDSTSRPTAGLEWQQQLGAGYQFRLATESFASQNRYTVALERGFADGGGRHTFGINLIGVQGRDGLRDDKQVQLAYSYTFGKGAAPVSGSMGAANPAPAQAGMLPMQGREKMAGSAMPASNLLDEVAMRPNYVPSMVVAKVDTTAAPTRLVAVTKGALPAGSSVNAATGDVTVPLGVNVTGFAGITKNHASFSNTGQFALATNTLTVRPSQMVQPAAGFTDTYLVVLNNAGGGTTTVTVQVSKGSVHIDSIVVSSGAPDTTAPTTTGAPSVSGTTATSTTLSAKINEAGTGYYLVQPAASAVPTAAAVIAANHSFAMTANTPATASISGLTASTAYKVYFVAKDTAGNTQASVQSVAVTTGAAPDTTAPTTTGAPSVSGTTATSTILSAKINEAGTGYYLVQPAASAAPTVAGVIAAHHSFAMAANTPATASISGLTASTAYKVYFVAKDTAGNAQSAVQSVAVTTSVAPDTTAPTTTAAPSISVAATATTVSVTQTINEAGTGYYLVLPAASAAPTVAAVKAGTSFAMTANTPAEVAITGLTASTAYKYYFVAKDVANNDQAAVSSGLAITTTAAANVAPTANNFTYASNIGNSPKTFDWKVLSAAADANGDTLTATVKTGGTKGVAYISGDNITYQPNPLMFGSDSLVITLSDGHGGLKDITITVNGIDVFPPTGPVTWLTPIPNRAATTFRSVKIQIQENGLGLDPATISMSSEDGSVISNISTSGNVITFDIDTTSDVGESLTITGADLAGNSFMLNYTVAPNLTMYFD